ncbi:hypothetical protein U7230_02265 [Carboxydochorda subterranea]|uniref:Uncharacterized protein n=1 Tax=Carboxydichorda subterranea TaxID=3109565 RepID=A0ABZ1BYQ4_9FIRM|nr:hypothetical protein [Limnochorda sp. L945t]WRP17858.1 hypothetical protein U7230_02265 [Limnochorda sp. L945t]
MPSLFRPSFTVRVRATALGLALASIGLGPGGSLAQGLTPWHGSSWAMAGEAPPGSPAAAWLASPPLGLGIEAALPLAPQAGGDTATLVWEAGALLGSTGGIGELPWLAPPPVQGESPALQSGRQARQATLLGATVAAGAPRFGTSLHLALETGGADGTSVRLTGSASALPGEGLREVHHGWSTSGTAARAGVACGWPGGSSASLQVLVSSMAGWQHQTGPSSEVERIADGIDVRVVERNGNLRASASHVDLGAALVWRPAPAWQARVGAGWVRREAWFEEVMAPGQISLYRENVAPLPMGPEPAGERRQVCDRWSGVVVPALVSWQATPWAEVRVGLSVWTGQVEQASRWSALVDGIPEFEVASAAAGGPSSRPVWEAGARFSVGRHVRGDLSISAGGRARLLVNGRLR